MGDTYNELISRNWAFVSPQEQSDIRRCRLVFAGCGLASTIASLAARTGFENMTLIDHDVVEVSNLNRQDFTTADLGANKAVALAKRLALINPGIDARIFTERIEPIGVDGIVELGDIVVNTVDFDESAWALNRAAREAGKPVLFPMNMGWGGFCLLFTPDSPGLEDLVGPEPPETDAEFLGRLFAGLEQFPMPRYLAARLAELPRIVSAAELPAPQTGIAAFRSASLVVEAMVRLATNRPARPSPHALVLDAWDDWNA